MTTAPAANPAFMLRGEASWREPWTDYRRLRDDAPVLAVDHAELGRFWVLTRFADVFEAARDTATFSSAQGLTPGTDAMALFDETTRPIVMMDPPDHTAMRRLVSRAMTPRMVATNEDAVRDFVRRRLETIGHGDDVDIVERLFKPLPSFVVAHHLGVPIETRSAFDGWTNSIVAASAVSDLGAAQDAVGELATFAIELIEQRRLDPGDDLVTLLVEADIDVAVGWIIGFVFTMVTGGNDTTTGLLSGAAELLTRHPDQRRALAKDPGLLTTAVEEFLRLTSPVQNLARTTTRRVEFHGAEIPAGDKVLLVYGSANRDEREFGPTAGELNVSRDIARTLALGSGAHHCLGAAAARLQTRVALEELLARFPTFAVDWEAGTFAPGAYVRRYQSLPFCPEG